MHKNFEAALKKIRLFFDKSSSSNRFEFSAIAKIIFIKLNTTKYSNVEILMLFRLQGENLNGIQADYAWRKAWRLSVLPAVDDKNIKSGKFVSF